MEITKLLKHRDKLEDTIIFKESLIETNEFTGLIEKSFLSNIQTTTLFLIKYQFENMDSNSVIEKVKKYVPIGDDFKYFESNPYITITYEKKPRKGSN